MRFTLLGHSCLYLETRAGSILVDPWLFGSVGWRSWWHYPPSVVPDACLRPDFVYLTHHHPDHFHYPTMRRLERHARVLIPRFGVDVMPGEVRGLGFREVTEMGHAEPLELGSGVRVASYQYGFDDTVFVVQDGADVLADFNDCKMRGRPLRQILRDFGRPTFLLKGYSFAQGYPHCYQAEDPADLDLVSRKTYYQDFIDAAIALRARYAIPFASMVAFLHPESFHVNRHVITPAEVATAFDQARDEGALPETELVCMQPGDSWDADSGFRISPEDWYSERERHLQELAEQARPRIEKSLAEERRRSLSPTAFVDYFEAFARALPPLVGRLLVPRPIVFHVPSASEPYFVVDLKRRRVRCESSAPAERASLIRISEGVLADAIDKRLVAIIQASMRLQTELRPRGVNEDLAFWGLLAIWELGYLPWPRLFRPRVLGVAWRRRREFGELARALGASGSPLRRLSRAFAKPGEGSAGAAR